MHAAPPMPQADGSGGAVHVVPEQQPAGHEVALHAHAPFTHCCPAPQADPPSQRHTPSTQESATMPQFTHPTPPMPQADALGVAHVVPEQQPSGQEIGSQMQVPLKHRCPDPHADPPSQ